MALSPIAVDFSTFYIIILPYSNFLSRKYIYSFILQFDSSVVKIFYFFRKRY